MKHGGNKEQYTLALSSDNQCQPHQAANGISNDHDYLLFVQKT